MHKPSPIILLTRPLAQAEKFADECHKALGAEVMCAPLMLIEHLQVSKGIDGYGALVFSSENAVQAYIANWDIRNIPAYCVGEKTAQRARNAGMDAVSADGTADDLIALVQRSVCDLAVLHVRGEYSRGNIAQKLGAKADEIITYRQTSISLSIEAQVLLKGDIPVILPLFSPRTARLFIAEDITINVPLHIIAISNAVAKEVTNVDKKDISVAKVPNATEMLKLIKETYRRIEAG